MQHSVRVYAISQGVKDALVKGDASLRPVLPHLLKEELLVRDIVMRLVNANNCDRVLM